MTVLYIALGIIALLLVITFIVCWILSGIVVKPKVIGWDECYKKELDEGTIEDNWYKACDFYEFTVRSDYGYDMHCMELKRKPGASFPDGRERVVVLVHGYTYTLLGGMKYARIFHDLGFNCVFFDHRNHGKSPKAPTSMGCYEAVDTAAVCRWARERYGENCVLGTHGESMGGATVLVHAPTDPKLAFVVEDCGYSDLYSELWHNVKKLYHLPQFPTMAISSLLARLRGGVAFKQVRPAECAAKCPEELPMLFVHGEADDFVPFKMVYENYNAKPGKKAIATYPGATHAESFRSDPQRYREMLTGFLGDNGII